MRGRAAPKRRSRFRYIGDVIAELRKVVWPTRREAVRLTIMVVVVSLIVGLLLGGIDFSFTKLTQAVLSGAR